MKKENKKSQTRQQKMLADFAALLRKRGIGSHVWGTGTGLGFLEWKLKENVFLEGGVAISPSGEIYVTLPWEWVTDSFVTKDWKYALRRILQYRRDTEKK